MRQALDKSVILLLAVAVPLTPSLAAPWWLGISIPEIWTVLQRYLGPWLFFFVPVAAFETYVFATWLADRLGIVWFDHRERFDQDLDWVSQTAPLCGLIATVLSALDALITLGASGIGNSVSRSAFLSAFGTALATTAAGATLALLGISLRSLIGRN